MFILEFIKTCEYNTQLRFVTGAIFGFSTLYDLFLGLFLLHIVALGREYYDYKMSDGIPKFSNYTATVAGGLFSMLILSIVTKVV